MSDRLATLACRMLQDGKTAALKAGLARPADPLPGADYDVHRLSDVADSVCRLSDADFDAEPRL